MENFLDYIVPIFKPQLRTSGVSTKSIILSRPIYGEGDEPDSVDMCFGHGVFVKNLFITAGHIVNGELPLWVECNNQRFRLTEDNLIAFFYDQKGEDPLYRDFAVFKVEGINSPLSLSDFEPQENTSYSIHTFRPVQRNDEDVSDNLKKESISSRYIQFTTTGTIIPDEKEGFLLWCKTADCMQSGDSGSPMIDSQGNVVGILVCGSEGKEISDVVGFQRCSKIEEYLQQIG